MIVNLTRFLISIAASFVFFTCAHRSAVYYPKVSPAHKEMIREKIEKEVEATDPNVNLGIKAVSCETGEVFYEKNGNNLFTPASNVKLFTTAGALHFLGPSFRFNTRMYADSTREGSVLRGNLYLVGGGDPDFTHEELQEMVEDLRNRGIERIEGDIVVDNSDFDLDPWGPGWMWDEGPLWYFAPVDAMTVNDNCVTVIVSPGESDGDLAIARLDPPTDYVQVNMEAVTVAADSGGNLEVDRRWKTKENIVDVSGEIHVDDDARSFVLSVENPSLYAGTLLGELLDREGIEFAGSVYQDTVPNGTFLITTLLSGPLSTSIKNFLKISDNLTGELLVKKIGAVTDSTVGTWENGLKAIRTFLQQEVGIDTTRFVLADGSGISRYNLVSANHIVQLLLWASDNFQIFPEFSSALPIGGADGTLRKRMLSLDTRKKARAKTGTLQGVSSLSGYVTTADGELLAFSLLMNGYTGGTDPYRRLQDRIVSILTSFSRYP